MAEELNDQTSKSPFELEELAALELADQIRYQTIRRDIAPAVGAELTSLRGEVVPLRRKNVPPRPGVKRIRTIKDTELL